MPSRQTYTDLDIINQALTAEGERTIDDLENDQSVAAQVMRLHYTAVKEYCLTMSNWRFATTKKDLGAALSDTPLNRWAAAFQLPVDMLKLLYVWPPAEYEVQGNKLFINARSRVQVDYIRVIEEAYWLPWFTRLVVAELVMRTCKGITGDDPSTGMAQERTAAKSEAYFQDAQQQPNQTLLPNAFIDARF